MKRLIALSLLLLFTNSCKKADYLYPQEPPIRFQAEAEDRFVEHVQYKDKLDVLWIIDNSPSMDDEQQRVIDNTRAFIREFKVNSKMKWKMGLISTDEINKPYAGFAEGTEINHETPDAVPRFQEAVGNLGITGSGDEKMFDPVMKVFKQYPKFNRDGALLALIVLSDEPEQSQNFKLPKFADELKKIKGSLEDVALYAILGGQDDCGPFPVPTPFCALCYKGGVYEKLVQLLNGKKYLTCADFSHHLVDIGRELADRISTFKIHMKRRPLVSSIEVTYAGKKLKGGPEEDGGLWVYDSDENAIIFHQTAIFGDGGKSVSVRYQGMR